MKTPIILILSLVILMSFSISALVQSGQENVKLITIPTEFSLNIGQTVNITNYGYTNIKLTSIRSAFVTDNTISSTVVNISIPTRCAGFDGPCIFDSEIGYIIYEGANLDLSPDLLASVRISVQHIEKDKVDFKINFIDSGPPTACVKIAPYCPYSELIEVGKSDDGCPMYNCVTNTEKCKTDLDCKTGICPDGSTYNKYSCNDNECVENKFFRDPCQSVKSCNGHSVGESYPSLDGCNTCKCILDGSGNVREICTERACLPNECPQLGFRESGKYCDVDNKWQQQKQGRESCDNSFECNSNSCLDNKCTEPGFWTKLSEWLSRLFSLRA